MKLAELALQTQLFRGLSLAEAETLLYRLNGVKKVFKKGETVLHAGFDADRLMVVASGRLHVYEQMAGDRSVLVRDLGAGEVVGLWILSAAEVIHWPGMIEAAEPCTLISLSMATARRLMDAADPLMMKLTVNAVKILSCELFATWRKLSVMDAPGIEGRVRVYLAELDNEGGRTGEVVVPFNRERMAEYFGVTRPSLSRALCQMRDRGLLTWCKNIFKINFNT